MIVSAQTHGLVHPLPVLPIREEFAQVLFDLGLFLCRPVGDVALGKDAVNHLREDSVSPGVVASDAHAGSPPDRPRSGPIGNT